MEQLNLILTILLATITAWYLLKPHIRDASGSASVKPKTDAGLLDHKDRVLQVLKDLELDYSTGKVAVEDYQRTRELLRGEAATVLEKLDAISKR